MALQYKLQQIFTCAGLRDLEDTLSVTALHGTAHLEPQRLALRCESLHVNCAVPIHNSLQSFQT